MNTPRTSAFSIIEVIIGIFIFTLGLISIYSLLASSLHVDAMNKNSTIANNLAREQIELMKNIRDSNYEGLRKWSYLDTEDSPLEIEENEMYTLVFNDDFIPEFKNYGSIDDESEEFIESEDFRVCRQSASGGYLMCDQVADDEEKIETHFYKYVTFIKISDDTYEMISKVIWFYKGRHEIELKTILTDWRRI